MPLIRLMVTSAAVMLQTGAGLLPPTPTPALDALEGAIALLAAEARLIEAGHVDQPDEADFARRYPMAIEAHRLVEVLGRSADRDPFVDAYVRWQLTSLDPELPRLDDRVFSRFVRHAPALVANPRADPRTVWLFDQARESGPLPAAATERLRRISEQLEMSTTRARRLNEAAVGFYDWARTRLGPTAMRRHQWLLRHLAATVSAGWPAASLKSAITRDLATRSPLTPAQQRSLVGQSKRLIGLESTIVDSVTFLADGTLRARLTTTSVSAEDVERWIERFSSDG